ncbi:hypothetical protein B0H13DRAFT_1854832 [Mycena leptocephala]|nr:hypothetical protein B0H13DRAFT_1854832 [Mycena leptocephala]
MELTLSHILLLTCFQGTHWPFLMAPPHRSPDANGVPTMLDPILLLNWLKSAFADVLESERQLHLGKLFYLSSQISQMLATFGQFWMGPSNEYLLPQNNFKLINKAQTFHEFRLLQKSLAKSYFLKCMSAGLKLYARGFI